MSMDNVCIITEALEAYQSFCETIPRHTQEGQAATTMGVPIGTAASDLALLLAWIPKYKQEHHNNRWWERASTDEIMSMLWVAPLNDEAYVEVSTMLLVCFNLDD